PKGAGQNPAYTPSGARRSGHFSGSNRDKCGFRGTTVWIAKSAVACRETLSSVTNRVVDAVLAAVTQDRKRGGTRGVAPHYGGRCGRSDWVARSFLRPIRCLDHLGQLVSDERRELCCATHSVSHECHAVCEQGKLSD